MTPPSVLLNLPTSPPLRVSVVLSPTATLQDLGPEEHIVWGNQERKHEGKVDYWAVALLQHRLLYSFATTGSGKVP